MMVFVATPRQFAAAFDRWIQEQPCDARKILQRVFEAFMCAPDAKPLRASSGLYSFTYSQWMESLQSWRARELLRQPEASEKIRRWTDALCALLQSEWPVRAKLVVQECIEDGDFAGSVPDVCEDLPERPAA